MIHDSIDINTINNQQLFKNNSLQSLGNGSINIERNDSDSKSLKKNSSFQLLVPKSIADKLNSDSNTYLEFQPLQKIEITKENEKENSIVSSKKFNKAIK